MTAAPRTVRVVPATSTVHLDFNAGEDVDILLAPFDDSDPAQALYLQDATATVAFQGGPALHVWSVLAGNLSLQPDPDDPTHDSRILLSTTAEETTSWWTAWGDAEWQLDVVDVFGQSKRACEGDVRVRQSRR